MSENNSIDNKLSIEEKYTLMSEIDHVLLRPAVYIGNIYSVVGPYNLYKPSDNMIVRLDKVGYNAGLLKLFDEILTNPIDERRRKSRLFDINRIAVRVMRDGTVSVRDDGGIPVVVHGVLKMYVSTMIFGLLKTSSNYTEEREGAGLNGLGAKLTNIYSTKFSVETADGANRIRTEWANNMKDLVSETVEPHKGHYTQVDFRIELSRFAIAELDTASIRIMQKRCIDACAANPGLEISFETDAGEGALNQTFKFAHFQEFVSLHLTEEQRGQCVSHDTLRDHVVILPNIGYDYGFINGAVCSQGTHIKKVMKKVTDKFLEVFRKKDMELITERDIRDAVSVFVSTSVTNPDYDAQTKTILVTPIPHDCLSLPKSFLDRLEEGKIVENMVEYYQLKYAAEQKKLLKKLNAEIKKTKSRKFTNCSNRTNKEQNELFLFEGTSAANGFAMFANPWNMASYELRGKVKNTLNLSKTEIVENQELREIIAILNLQFNDAQNNIKNCAFGKIVFGTDMDHDGSHICGLLITFFAMHFPELFLAKRIYRLVSPIIIASKGDPESGGQERYYYTLEEYDRDVPNIKGWDIAYKKGLGSLEDRHYEEMLHNQRLIQFKLKNKDYLNTVRTWFDKSTALRKELLMDIGDGGTEGMEDAA
jgi:DNA gyrase/topoisomerase IV subunit B